MSERMRAPKQTRIESEIAGALTAIAACLALLVLIGCSGDMKQVKRLEGNQSGLDPHAFATTGEMLSPRALLPFDDNAASMIAEIEQKLKDGATIDDEEIFALVTDLNRYVVTPEIQQHVAIWADMEAHRFWADSPDLGDHEQNLRMANSSYRGGGFIDAAWRYRDLLRVAPNLLDVRNNLALAAMHTNNDLAALLELETLRRVKPAYVPAIINLTVVYERLGRVAEAEELARTALQLGERVPSAIFNEAWYMNLRGEYAGADKLLHPLADLALAPKHVRMYDLNRMQAGMLPASIAWTGEGAVWKRGLVDIAGGAKTSIRKFIWLATFVSLSFLLIAFSTRNPAPTRRNLKAPAFFLAAGALVYTLYWGVPSGTSWGLGGAYLIVGMALTVGRARQRTNWS